jgi:FKBP-type peptidyl-prolyl cis-trans isomerase SlyD
MDLSRARACVPLVLVATGLLVSSIAGAAEPTGPPAEASTPSSASPSSPPSTGAVIAKGKSVGLEYTLTLDDGTTVQSNVGGPPLSYVAGQNQIIPGLESALDGHSVQDRVKVKIAPDQAYGAVDPKKIQEVPLDKVPEEARKVGTLLSAQGFDGPIRVAEVKSDVVVLDFNHPLAGKTLNFDVLVLSIN